MNRQFCFLKLLIERRGQEQKSTMVISFSCPASSRKLTWFLALLFIMARVYGQSTSGFISIDCGNSNTYNDITTGIQYQSDVGFVEGGLSYNISAEAPVANEQQKTLRSFPEGSRNCYALPSSIGKKYLLRATFTYRNYDGLNRTMDGSPFLFGLHIGVNFWETVNLTNWNDPLMKEVLTVAPGDSVSVCLINFGTGTPFVSSLELRPLQDAMYPFVNSSVSISYFKRFRFGNITDHITRNLSTSGLKGGFSVSFMNMSSLENLDLSYNNLTGAIPDYRIRSLRVLTNP
ncbi:probable LRR receptor-like serine/threonine-protein kinase At1g05700 isoform X5 [Triticum aestivum]|uniref:probable LRR receptor-like serine/threonine-protein kinase At1g05700 isoform X5 n=1 Tax=Triticum aestivum TaxID=4565 RepID=UPI001D0224D4|nr:probable LRR receptor-like serine/threonine-protein kinase At1g05700 isoform X5 [Triticum aestivum]XP_044341783.1 probable LRR receptor-like serine/threonine-protein kinase At1g05700 isoform X5 [Triticum aestivum]XP_044341784.1 probable LRR receptor-like serine/threonine-protein kinase At1g05700 isoform X5 [Triticum aestivum]